MNRMRVSAAGGVSGSIHHRTNIDMLRVRRGVLEGNRLSRSTPEQGCSRSYLSCHCQAGLREVWSSTTRERPCFACQLLDDVDRNARQCHVRRDGRTQAEKLGYTICRTCVLRSVRCAHMTWPALRVHNFLPCVAVPCAHLTCPH